MAWVTQHLIDIWNSGQYVGENTPQAVVEVQLGHWVDGWPQWADNPDPDGVQPRINAQIWGEGNYGPSGAQTGHWTRNWVGTTGWYTVPNLVSIKRTKDLTQNGITVLEVVVDALDYEPKTGALGDAYHVFVPGSLAPDRNYIGPTRPDPGWELTQWAPAGQESRITDSVAIRVWQGFGAPESDSDNNTPPIDGGSNGAWTFRGMIDDVDIEGDPNQITITARNGKTLTDMRVFRASKSVQIKDPITFYDSNAAVDPKLVGSGALGSSHSDDDHRAKNVLDSDGKQWDLAADRYQSRWESANSIDSDSLEWVEIRVPQGSYKAIWLETEPGLTAYVGVYAKPLVYHARQGNDIIVDTDAPTLDDSDLDPGWQGGTIAPGSNGGWPYVNSVTTGTTLPDDYTSGGRTLDRIQLGGTYELGKHSIIRVGFTRPSGSGTVQVGDLHAIQRPVQKDIVGQQFILVDDASDVVKVVLRWAGYQQWDVEQANVRLSDGTNYGPGVLGVAQSSGRLVFNRTQTLMDVINEVGRQLGWIFFITDPVDANSDGLPTFRRDSSLLTDNNYIAAELDDTNMLTGLRRKNTDEDKPVVIRVRGKTASARGGGVPLGGDSIRRIMAGYHCPWEAGSRMGGLLRHIVYQDDQLISYAMCLYGAVLIAMQAAVAMHTATVEIPAYPLLELDDQVSVIDEPTSTNSRLWIVKTDDTMTLGENAQWRETIEGSLLDSRDLQDVIAQCLGQQPMIVSAPPPAPGQITTIDSIDWNHVTNPFRTNDVSGYTSPVIKVEGRKGRTR